MRMLDWTPLHDPAEPEEQRALEAAVLHIRRGMARPHPKRTRTAAAQCRRR